MYCRVAPIRRLPRHAEPYDYAIPPHLTLAVGSFVSVPLRGRLLEGLVISLEETSRVSALKDVVARSPRSPLSAEQVLWYQAIASRTYQSVSSVLYAAFPPLLKRMTTSEVHADPDPLAVAAEDVPVLRQLKQQWQQDPYLQCAVPSDRLAWAFAAFVAREQGPLLVACPDLQTVARVHRHLVAYREDVHLYTGTQGKAAALRALEAVQQGQGVVIGTRIAGLLPLHPSVRILVLGSGEEEYLQERQNPHYDARWCWRELHRRQGNALCHLDVFPAIEDEAPLCDLWQPTAARIVSMHRPNVPEEFRLISRETLDLLRELDTSSAPCLLYYNRRGDKLSTCAYCGTLVPCAACQQPMEQRRDQLQCGACGAVRALPTQCPSCAQPWRKRSMGHTGMARYLTERLGKPVTVADAAQPLPEQGLVVTTSGCLQWLHPVHPRLSGLVVLSADQEMTHHQFRSLEQGSRRLRRLVALAQTAAVPCIIQTWSPETVLQALGPTQAAQKQEREIRQLLHYPPFADRVTVVCRVPDPAVEARLMELGFERLGSRQFSRKLPVGETIESLRILPSTCDVGTNLGTFSS